MIIPENLKNIAFKDINILPFSGMHWEKTFIDGKWGLHGVSATGYLVEFSGKRWLFTGDVRSYETKKLPPVGQVDGIFAHLWLGRHCALKEQPPLTKDFCDFYASLKPKRIVVTHLEELGRDALDYWDSRHYQLVKSRFQIIAPDIDVTCAHTGDEIFL